MRVLILAVLAVVAASPSLAAGDAAAGKAAFGRCAMCHAIGAGATNRVGPALTGVVGRQPGSFAGFYFSQPMKEFGTRNPAWTVELLGQFLGNPRAVVPGTKMAFAGLTNEADVDNIIAYLQSESNSGTAPAAPAN